jgi:hypothetical protein
MDQITRIQEMEKVYREASAVLPALQAALDAYEALLPRLTALAAYYTSPLWRADFADDEAGKLPSDLPRGILSEDGIWNLLTDQHHLLTQMEALVQK